MWQKLGKIIGADICHEKMAEGRYFLNLHTKYRTPWNRSSTLTPVSHIPCNCGLSCPDALMVNRIDLSKAEFFSLWCTKNTRPQNRLWCKTICNSTCHNHHVRTISSIRGQVTLSHKPLSFSSIIGKEVWSSYSLELPHGKIRKRQYPSFGTYNQVFAHCNCALHLRIVIAHCICAFQITS